MFILKISEVLCYSCVDFLAAAAFSLFLEKLVVVGPADVTGGHC